MKRLLVLALLFVLWPSLAARAENEPSGTVDPEDLPSHPVPPGDVAAPPLGAPALPRCDDSARGAGEARYREEAIGFTDLVDKDGVQTWGEAYLGRRHLRLSPTDFLTRLARPDLVQRLRARNRLKTGLVTAGLVFVGAMVTSAIIYGAVAQSQYDSCIRSSESSGCSGPAPALWGSLLVLAGTLGAATAITGGALPDNPLPPVEMRQLADGYNRGLRMSIGLPPE